LHRARARLVSPIMAKALTSHHEQIVKVPPCRRIRHRRAGLPARQAGMDRPRPRLPLPVPRDHRAGRAALRPERDRAVRPAQPSILARPGDAACRPAEPGLDSRAGQMAARRHPIQYPRHRLNHRLDSAPQQAPRNGVNGPRNCRLFAHTSSEPPTDVAAQNSQLRRPQASVAGRFWCAGRSGAGRQLMCAVLLWSSRSSGGLIGTNSFRVPA
jgi:hypothetical protein